MVKTTKKAKGNRYERVTYHIPFYTTPFFDPSGELEDSEVAIKTSSTVKIPVKISNEGDNSRANVTSFEMKGISHFDNNIENVLESLSQLKERVIKPKMIDDVNQELKTRLQLLQIICNSGPASQTLQEALKVACTHVYDKFLRTADDQIVNESANEFFESDTKNTPKEVQMDRSRRTDQQSHDSRSSGADGSKTCPLTMDGLTPSGDINTSG